MFSFNQWKKLPASIVIWLMCWEEILKTEKKECVHSESLRLNLFYFRSEVKINIKSKFQYLHNSRVFLLRQLWIVNYSVKSSLNNLSNENINIDVSVVFKTKGEWKCQNELFLKYHFSGNTSNNWWSIIDVVQRLLLLRKKIMLIYLFLILWTLQPNWQ